jgi:hypothetical protein
MEQGLLDEGTLFVAHFEEGALEWRPLVYGEGPLTNDNGFASQADVVIEARRAADLVGATPMDRPEDVETNPVTGHVYAVLTGNPERPAEKVDAANPRSWNQFGHILELIPPRAANGAPDHGAAVFTWDVLLLAGFENMTPESDQNPGASARYGAGTKVALLNPDNCAFDPKGRMWIGTDQADQTATQKPDGLFACELEGEGRAVVKFFYACPAGAELCGPAFTPDGKTLFVSVQHPADDEAIDASRTYWPDFTPGLPPRPSVVVITREGGGPIGG